MDEDWQGYKRLHHVWAHIETKNAKFYVHEDGTEEGIANRLLSVGVPKERIVLALDAPNLRAESGFAPA
ncbi:MAG: XisI protein [Armatimonadetes bacterium]|nr:XisI protein [Armatimonadota bacterium]